MKRTQRLLLEWYERHGRDHLPWRRTRDPYAILVSEFMLQQTQVDRVVPKYHAFLDRFPTLRSLAQAPAADVVRLWRGLGYNSRAIRLKQLACEVVERFNGALPRQTQALRSLPGMGPYTAAAVRAFAFEEDGAAADTNVRRVVHRLRYGMEYPAQRVASQLDGDAEQLVPRGKAHAWNSAMMDLGATICTARAPKCLLCPMQTVCRAAPLDAVHLDRARDVHQRAKGAQAAVPFKDSTRYARGRIVDRLRDLPPGERISLLDLHCQVTRGIGKTRADLLELIAALLRDGLVHLHEERICLRE